MRHIVKKVLLITMFIVLAMVSGCTTINSSTGTTTPPNIPISSSTSTTTATSTSAVSQPTSTTPTSSTSPVSQTTKTTIITSTTSVSPSTSTTTTQTATTTSQYSFIDKNRMEAIDLYVKNTPASATTSVQTLASYLIQPAQNDVEKVRAVYDWIAMNISYNYNEYLNPTNRDTSAGDVLQSRSSVCEGYSNLFQNIAKAAGLEVTTINGWGKGIGYSAGQQITGPSDHAWNAVKINGAWYLLDSTWGAGYIDEQNNFVFDFDDEYFLMLPEQFIYTHFPEDAKWQLLNSPLSNAAFADLPDVQRRFFSYGLGLDSSLKSVMTSNGDVSFSISAPANILVRAMLLQGNQQMSDTLTFTQRTGNQYQVNAICPNAGDYTLRIYVKQKDDTPTYHSCLDFKITASGGSATRTAFPKAYGTFFDDNAFVNTPLNGNLKSGTVQHFSFNIPNTTDVQIVIGSKWTPLTRQGENFAGNVTLISGNLQVCAQFPGNPQYSVLLVYTVQ